MDIFPPDHIRMKIIEYYHLSRAAGANTRYERLLQTSKWCAKEFPQFSSSCFYKWTERVTSLIAIDK